MTNQQVSILIPCFNTPKAWLTQCLNSVFGQVYSNYEIVIVNDKSTNEDTLQFLKEIKDIKNVVIVNNKENVGIGTSLNNGLKSCSNELVFRLDSDDIAYPQRLQKQLEYLEANPNVNLIGTGLKYYVNQGNNLWCASNDVVIHPPVITKDVAKNSNWFVNHPTVLYKKSEILSIGGYREDLRGLPEDFDLWLRMIKNGMILHNMQESLLYLRINPKSLSNTNKHVFEFCKKLRDEL